jgi:hypothetical protein
VDQLQAHDAQAARLVALDDLADQQPLDGVGLDQINAFRSRKLL